MPERIMELDRKLTQPAFILFFRKNCFTLYQKLFNQKLILQNLSLRDKCQKDNFEKKNCI